MRKSQIFAYSGRYLRFSLLLGALAGLTGRAEPTPPAAAAAHPRLVVAVIPKGTTHEFW